MLAASRPLVNSPWVCVSCSHLVRKVTLRASVRRRHTVGHIELLGQRHVGPAGTVLSFSNPCSSTNECSTPGKLHVGTESQASVFEEASEDYTAVMVESKPLPPSILELVKTTLPSVLPEPVADDPSVFEERDSDYITYAPAEQAVYSSTHALAHLITDHRYEEAYSLFVELRDLGVVIPPSRFYEQAALASLRVPEESVSRFADWFSLIPPAHLAVSPRKFEEVRRVILQTPIINLHLVTSMALILASKGYADVISIHAVPLVIRYASPEMSRQFLDDFMQAHRLYWNSHRPQDAPYMMKKTFTNVRGIAIRALAFSRRLEEAVALLPDSHNSTFRLTRYTYDVLLRGLRTTREHKVKQHIPLVMALRNQESTSIPAPHHSSDILADLSENAGLMWEIKFPTPIHVSDSLAETLRYLKNGLSSNADIPHPYTIVNFFAAYQLTGRSRGLALLLQRSIRSSYASTSAFVLAEMLYYQKLKQHSLVIQAFVDHFYLSGVPRDDVLTCYNRLKHQQAEFSRQYHVSTEEEEAPPHRVCEYGDGIVLPRGKLWPSAQHCNLVWHSLVAIAPDDATVERLYHKLLKVAADGHSPEPNGLQSIKPLVTPVKVTTSSGAFIPFIKRLMFASGAGRGAKIISNMLTLGLRPNVYHFTELAGRYARMGDARRAFLLLNKMENQTKIGTASSATAEQQDNIFPPPDLIMYISLVRGFILARNLEGALEVDRRMRLVHEHVLGQNEYLDIAYADLQALKQEVAGASP
ncbi:hypothetical protein K443DRAFT_674423 [Laccaria amethystina LaAM-08-1]|uniref:Pentatricopeptide repeat protein n=1 Tax=Laccaria amethystina LaAM-08-1 TaxID=1095629 RepID=A0A0C9XXV4_9AGAR|nr:hypothetical protein K443DRAFT_674423 [Laccaria amethystina LaAM-08-1]